MKLLIRLAITALLANAAFRFGNEYLIHYRFTDSVREVATYRAGSDAELRQRVLETAMSYFFNRCQRLRSLIPSSSAARTCTPSACFKASTMRARSKAAATSSS